MSPQQAQQAADVIDLREYVERRDISPEDKLRRIARDLHALRVLSGATTQVQRTAADAVAAMATVLDEEIVPVIIRMENAIGQAPDPKALAHASSLDLSPDAIRKAELGSGMRRDVAELRVMFAALDRKLAAGVLGVATAASVLPAVFAALPGSAQIVSGVVLALVTGLAGVWASRKKAPPALPPKDG